MPNAACNVAVLTNQASNHVYHTSQKVHQQSAVAPLTISIYQFPSCVVDPRVLCNDCRRQTAEVHINNASHSFLSSLLEQCALRNAMSWDRWHVKSGRSLRECFKHPQSELSNFACHLQHYELMVENSKARNKKGNRSQDI